MSPLEYVVAGIVSVLQGPAAFELLGIGVPTSILMVLFGFALGVFGGATPGLAGPMIMAIALPALIAAFGVGDMALLPVLGCLIGIMKGATLGGAVPAILFRAPGTPDAYVTTFDGHPMAKRGEAGRALRIAHFSSVSGDTASDLVLIICAPFLALAVEAYLDLPEKTALLLLSMAFIAAVIGKSVGKGLIATALGLLFAAVGTGEGYEPRLALGNESLSDGFLVAAVVLGVLVLGEVFTAIEEMIEARRRPLPPEPHDDPQTDQRLTRPLIRRLLPFIAQSSAIGTVIGALPGVGSTLAASLGYSAGKELHTRTRKPGMPRFGEGAPEGVAATEAANSSVMGANLIPVLSIGIPGNISAVFLILATESVGGFMPGPSVFEFSTASVNQELVFVFGLFTMMIICNAFSWTIGGVLMRRADRLARVPREILMPAVLLLTLTSLYVQRPQMTVLWTTIAFGVLGHLMRRLGISPLPFVIAFILGRRLEDTTRQAFDVTGADPFFLFSSVTASAMTIGAFAIVLIAIRRQRRGAVHAG